MWESRGLGGKGEELQWITIGWIWSLVVQIKWPQVPLRVTPQPFVTMGNSHWPHEWAQKKNLELINLQRWQPWPTVWLERSQAKVTQDQQRPPGVAGFLIHRNSKVTNICWVKRACLEWQSPLAWLSRKRPPMWMLTRMGGMPYLFS